MPEGQESDEPCLARKLATIKDLVSRGEFHYSAKVNNYMQKGCYELDDLVRCIQTATSIQKAEEDELGTAVDGYKYVILGRDRFRQVFYTCGKLLANDEDRTAYFFITAHGADE